MQRLLPEKKHDTYVPNPFESPLPPLLDTKTIIRDKDQHNLAKKALCLLMGKNNCTPDKNLSNTLCSGFQKLKKLQGAAQSEVEMT